jgi:competence protein ComEA
VEKLMQQWRMFLVGIGILFVIGGIGIYQLKNNSNNNVEIVEGGESDSSDGGVIVEISGAVNKPGVYTLSSDARVEDALNMAGGVTEEANREWMEMVLNRASKVSDGQKIYIPKQSEDASATNSGTYSGGGGSVSGVGSGTVSVNTASQKELEALPGIGPVTAQNIIEQRPYSSVEELKTKKILNSSVYEKNKNKLTIY